MLASINNDSSGGQSWRKSINSDRAEMNAKAKTKLHGSQRSEPAAGSPEQVLREAAKAFHDAPAASAAIHKPASPTSAEAPTPNPNTDGETLGSASKVLENISKDYHEALANTRDGLETLAEAMTKPYEEGGDIEKGISSKSLENLNVEHHEALTNTRQGLESLRDVMGRPHEEGDDVIGSSTKSLENLNTEYTGALTGMQGMVNDLREVELSPNSTKARRMQAKRQSQSYDKISSTTKIEAAVRSDSNADSINYVG